MKAILAVVAVIVLAFVAYAFVKYRAIQQAATGPAKEIVSESMEKTGDTWRVRFVSKFDAPLDTVFDAFQHPERVKEFGPEDLQKGAIRETYITQVRAVNRALGLAPMPEKRAAG